ncbi:MAG: hypothetical protein RIA09_15800 [Hoeflea sp.]|uniref:hypothetical protein n=1 Tax=Hoeflea sp. TaxID=1940281 RepID=UPI0032F04629
MSTLKKVWDPKGEPFEVSPRRSAQLLADGWTDTKPEPKKAPEPETPETPQPKRTKSYSKRTTEPAEEVSDD